MTQQEKLDKLAKKLRRHAKDSRNGITASITVKASASVRLGFDAGSKITADTLREALFENFLETLTLSAFESVDSQKLNQVTYD